VYGCVCVCVSLCGRSPLSMEVLVQQCTADHSLLMFAAHLLRPHKSKQHVSFWLRLTLLFIDNGHANDLPESAVSNVLAGVLAALADGTHRQLQTAAYMIVTKLFCRAQPSAELWTNVVDLVAKNADANDAQAALLCIVGLHQHNATFEMSKSAFNYVVKFDRLPQHIIAIAEKYEVSPFLRHFLSLLVSNGPRNSHCARIVQELASTLPAIDAHAASLAKQLLHSADQCSDDSGLPFFEQLLRTLALRCADTVDQVLNEHWSSKAPLRSRPKTPAEGLPFYLSIFDGTRHHFLHSANCTLHLGLNHASAAVRLLALEFLADPRAAKQDSEYVYTVLLQRMGDDDGGVVGAAIEHLKQLLQSSACAVLDRAPLLSACISVIGSSTDALFEHGASSVHPVKVRGAALELLLLALGTDAELGASAVGYTLPLLMPAPADHKWAAKAAAVAAASGHPLFQDLPDLSAFLSSQTSQSKKKEKPGINSQCAEAALATAQQIATNLLTDDSLVDLLIMALSRMQPSTMLILVLHEYCRLADGSKVKKPKKSTKRSGQVYESLLAMIHMTISVQTGTRKEKEVIDTAEIVETGKAVGITSALLSAAFSRGSSASQGSSLILQMLSNCVHFAAAHEVAILYRYLMLISASLSFHTAQPLIQSFVSVHIRNVGIDMLDFSSEFAVVASAGVADLCIAVQSLYICAAYISACAKQGSTELPPWQSISSHFMKLLISVSLSAYFPVFLVLSQRYGFMSIAQCGSVVGRRCNRTSVHCDRPRSFASDRWHYSNRSQIVWASLSRVLALSHRALFSSCCVP
jgi:hypothetical protein